MRHSFLHSGKGDPRRRAACDSRQTKQRQVVAFNYLLKTNRAIVSDIAGTTRDFIEERLIIGGIVFNLTDTAGLRSSEDHIESEGIKRSFSKIDEADLIIYLIDSSAGDNETAEEMNSIEKNFDQKKTIPVFSKSDLGKIREGKLEEKLYRKKLRM
ncbi:MAG: 50S ribosome-binding GTPase [Ignavibacteria bacterium]|nr:50S ribosome-binding GTPase [Ignavibacteria bacterium]